MHSSITGMQMSRRNFIALAGVAGVSALTVGLTGCAGKDTATDKADSDKSEPATTAALSGSITAVGSTALQPLVEAAAEQFMQENPDVQITIQGGGSGQGVTQIAQGAVEIGNSDVFAENKLDNPADAANLIDNKVCVVGMGPVAHKDCGADDLTMEQLQGIFTGAITNWSEVGGADQEIVVINRASGSGTRATFEDAVLDGVKVPDDFNPQEQDSSGTVATMVAQTPGSISYLAFSYFSDDIAILKVDGVAPETKNVEDNSWSIWSYEHMYTAKDPDEATQAFIDYMFSDDVQGSLVEETGYIPISGMKIERDKDGKVTEI